MGKHTAPPMLRREYGRNVTTYPVTSTYTEPPLDRVVRVLEDYRTTMALLNLDATRPASVAATTGRTTTLAPTTHGRSTTRPKPISATCGG